MNLVKEKKIILKTISWRMVGTLTTIIIGWIISGDMKIGFTIGGIEFFSKIILYYLHEKIWDK